MRCGSTRQVTPAGCRCGSTTVFEGATIGQVFTGDVEITCLTKLPPERVLRRQPSTLDTFVAIAIWQALESVVPAVSGPQWQFLPTAAVLLIALSIRASVRYLKASWGHAI